MEGAGGDCGGGGGGTVDWVGVTASAGKRGQSQVAGKKTTGQQVSGLRLKVNKLIISS